MNQIKSRETQPDLWINEKGGWIFEGNEIQNEGVLKYFKKQLRRVLDEKGVEKFYIENIFGELKEHAYLKKVLGFPLFVKNIVDKGGELSKEKHYFALLDSGEEIMFNSKDVFIESDTCVYIIFHQKGGVRARLLANAMFALSEISDSFFV